MSRIQQILDKAEREGRMRRTVGVTEVPAVEEAHSASPAPAGVEQRSAVAPPFEAPARRIGPPRPMVTAPAPPPPRPVAPVAPPIAPAARPADAHLNRVLVTVLKPHSAAAEQFRALRTRIAQSEHGRYYRTILVTSPAEGDGKSITSLNLALAMAQEFHRRVLMIDADLRNPSLHRLLGIPGQPGLSDVLLGDARLEDVMVSVASHRLTVIPAGIQVDRPTELLGSAEMRQLVDTLRTQFDRIVFDTPPASPLADVNVLAPIVDGVLLVVRAGFTQRPAIDRALEDIDPDRVMGLVLNDVAEADMGYGYGYGGDQSAPAPVDASTPPRRRTRASA